MDRRLAAILVADVADYTRLTEQDETGTHVRLMNLRRNVIEPGIAAHQGKIVKNTGDGFLSVFTSVLDAVTCSVELQEAVLKSEAQQSDEHRILLRLGINIAEVIFEDFDVFGDGVNLAARLQQAAEPGGIIISAAAREQIGNNLPVPCIETGALRLKNLQRPVRAFRLLPPGHTQAIGRITPPADRASIAVLPFRSLDSNHRGTYLGDGIVEDIIGTLSSFPELLVISRNSTLAFRDVGSDVRAVGRHLGVRYVLNGSVRRMANRLRVTAELSEAESAEVIWAGRYDEASGNVFDIQDQVTAQIVHVIAPQVRQLELLRIRLKRPESLDAYDLVMQALDLHHLLDRRAFARARTLLRRAIALDPGYATPYELLAWWYGLRYGQGWSDDPRADAMEAHRLAAMAIERDPWNPRALAWSGHHRSFLFRDFEGAKALLDRALTAAPSSALAWALSSPTFSYIGNPGEAIKRVERGLRLSPLDPHAFWYHSALALGHFTAGSFKDAVHWSRMAFQENPEYLANLRFLVAGLVALERMSEADEAARRLLAIDPRFRVGSFVEKYAYQDPERRREFGLLLLKAGLPG